MYRCRHSMCSNCVMLWVEASLAGSTLRTRRRFR
ncbi:hypothetical protein GX441_10695 [bacterium]|nr:hypothetical protein [bacterium]